MAIPEFLKTKSRTKVRSGTATTESSERDIVMPDENEGGSNAVSIMRDLRAQLEDLRNQLQAALADKEEYRQAVVTLGDERDEAVSALEKYNKEESATNAKLAALQAQIRERVHKDKFAALAHEAKMKPNAVEHLWKLAGYQSEDDEPNEKELKKTIERLRKEVDFAFEEERDESVEQQIRQAQSERPAKRTPYGLEIREEKEPPARGRAERNKGGDGTVITQEMRADPKFMLNPENRELIAQAAREHRFQ